MTETSAHPSARLRLTAAAFYLGLAPLLSAARLRRADPYLRHHHAQALAFGGLLLVELLAIPICMTLVGYLMVEQRAFIESYPVETVADVGLAAGGLAVLFAEVFGVMQALRGSARGIPLVHRLAVKPRWLATARAGGVAFWCVIALVALVTMHASSLTRRGGAPARAYLLYDDMGVYPGWVFDLGFCRLARAATDHWGPGSVVVAPLAQDTLADALRHGDFVFVASHGSTEGDVLVRGTFTGPDGEVYNHMAVKPDATLAAHVGPHLRFVYLTACDGGRKAAEWQATLAPAEVRTFDRLSAVVEHVYWLWFTGPAEFARLVLRP
jgi:hypothetical protein